MHAFVCHQPAVIIKRFTIYVTEHMDAVHYAQAFFFLFFSPLSQTSLKTD